MPFKVNEEFLKFLENTPEMLAKFVSIVNEWYKLQKEIPQPGDPADGPHDWVAGDTHDLTTVGITHDDLDAIAKGQAEAIVKEKAIAYIRGFMTAITLAV